MNDESDPATELRTELDATRSELREARWEAENALEQARRALEEDHSRKREELELTKLDAEIGSIRAESQVKRATAFETYFRGLRVPFFLVSVMVGAGALDSDGPISIPEWLRPQPPMVTEQPAPLQLPAPNPETADPDQAPRLPAPRER